MNIIKVEKFNNSIAVTAESPYACPELKDSAIWEYMGKAKIFFSIIFMGVGLLECFYGLKVLRLTLFIIGYFTGFGLLISSLAETVIKPDTDVAIVKACLVISILFGFLMGYLTVSIRRIGFFCLAFWLGTVIAFLLNNVGMY